MHLVSRNLIVLVAAICLPLSAAGYSLTHIHHKASIAFGASLEQWHAQPVWQSVLAQKPQVFMFLGDNVYTDAEPYLSTELPERINKAYRDLGKVKELQRFGMAKAIDVFATWNDHDYGEDGGNANFPYLTESRRYFAEFFGLELDSIGDTEERGIFHAQYRDIGGLRVQFLMLDTRSYRSSLAKQLQPSTCEPITNTAAGATILGEEQWKWLWKEFKKPADLRIIASSIQVLPTEHCDDKWANFPNERQRLFDLLKTSGVNGAIIVSGDRQLAEISKLDGVLAYPLYEITASGLNSALGANSPAAKEPNGLRTTANNFPIDNFGSIQIERQGDDALLQLQLHDVKGAVLEEIKLMVSELSVPKQVPLNE